MKTKEEMFRQMKEAERDIGKLAYQTAHVGKTSCMVISFFILLAVLVFATIVGYLGTKENLENHETKIELIEEAEASEVVPVQPEPEETSTSHSDNSIYNWSYAVDIWNNCKNDAYQYQDWANWYGEESAMRMCLITQRENGTREPARIGYNSDGSKDVGLFQINAYWHCDKVGEARSSNACIAKLQDAGTNVNVARQIYEAQGWTPWTAKSSYLPDFWADRVTIN